MDDQRYIAVRATADGRVHDIRSAGALEDIESLARGIARFGEPARIYEAVGATSVVAVTTEYGPADDYQPDLDNAVREGASFEELDTSPDEGPVPEDSTPAGRAGYGIGSRARVIRAHRLGSGLEIGDLVELAEDNGGYGPLWRRLHDGSLWFAYLGDVEHEWRPGDRARVLVDYPVGAGVRAGDEVELVEFDEDGDVTWRDMGGRVWYFDFDQVERLT